MLSKLLPLLLLAQAQPTWLSLALTDRDTVPTSTAPKWVARADGFETAEIDALVGKEKVDHLHLIRVEASKVRLQILNDPEGAKTADGWRDALGALAVVNGSYYLPDGTPETPLRSEGKRLGPAKYKSTHAALVAKDGFFGIADLAGKEVDAEIGAFPNAMASYPLLLEPSGEVRAKGRPTWLATRTFVALDRKGRLVIGTTETGYFALTRLGKFLKAAPLDLAVALNLDGGPVACQSVKAGGYEKTVYGQWELNDSSGQLVAYFGEGPEQRWRLPIVLAVLPK